MDEGKRFEGTDGSMEEEDLREPSEGWRRRI